MPPRCHWIIICPSFAKPARRLEERLLLPPSPRTHVFARWCEQRRWTVKCLRPTRSASSRVGQKDPPVVREVAGVYCNSSGGRSRGKQRSTSGVVRLHCGGVCKHRNNVGAASSTNIATTSLWRHPRASRRRRCVIAVLRRSGIVVTSFLWAATSSLWPRADFVHTCVRVDHNHHVCAEYCVRFFVGAKMTRKTRARFWRPKCVTCSEFFECRPASRASIISYLFANFFLLFSRSFIYACCL